MRLSGMNQLMDSAMHETVFHYGDRFIREILDRCFIVLADRICHGIYYHGLRVEFQNATYVRLLV